jgi:hypothetical protein
VTDDCTVILIRSELKHFAITGFHPFPGTLELYDGFQWNLLQ